MQFVRWSTCKTTLAILQKVCPLFQQSAASLVSASILVYNSLEDPRPSIEDPGPLHCSVSPLKDPRPLHCSVASLEDLGPLHFVRPSLEDPGPLELVGASLEDPGPLEFVVPSLVDPKDHKTEHVGTFPSTVHALNRRRGGVGMSATPVVGVGVAAPLGPAALMGLDHGGVRLFVVRPSSYSSGILSNAPRVGYKSSTFCSPS
ncbi:hypothetical protein QYF36_012617 [Acer negundo]|nr:hypothetical protein QYF36_012617 [Acer negundo]